MFLSPLSKGDHSSSKELDYLVYESLLKKIFFNFLVCLRWSFMVLSDHCYGHAEVVSKPIHPFPGQAQTSKQLTSTCAYTFPIH